MGTFGPIKKSALCRRAAAFGAMLTFSAAAAAAAEPLPDYTTLAQVNIDDRPGPQVLSRGLGAAASASHAVTYYSNPAGLGIPESYTGLGSAQAAASGTLSTTPYAYTSVQSSGHINADAEAEITYYFELNGESGAGPISMVAEFAMRSQAGYITNGQITYAPFFGEAHFRGIVSDGVSETPLFSDFGCSDVFGACTNTYRIIPKSFRITPNKVYQITLQAFASTRYPYAGQLGFNSSFLDAFIDPYIYVDPLNSDAAKYTLSFSDGVANNPAAPPSGGVPEPGTWFMLALGFALTGRSLRVHGDQLQRSGREYSAVLRSEHDRAPRLNHHLA